MSKARVALRIKEAVYCAKLSKNVDVEAAAARFRVLQKRLKLLAVALRNQYSTMVALQKNRCETVKIVTAIAANTPLMTVTGKLVSEGSQTTPTKKGSTPTNAGGMSVATGGPMSTSGTGGSNEENESPQQRNTAFGSIVVQNKAADDSLKVANSYASVHLAAYKRGVLYTEKFNQFVINYVLEWEKVVSTRVGAGLKKAEALRRDLDHYNRKVESLRQSAQKTMSSGKMVDPKKADQVRRNEEKLRQARKAHETFTGSLYMLIEEVTDRAWKDLHPMLVKLLQFDATFSADEAQIFRDLTEASNALAKVGTENKLEQRGRLKEIRDLSPEGLYTGDIVPQTHLRIENGSSTGGFGGPTPNGDDEGGLSWGSPPTPSDPLDGGSTNPFGDSNARSQSEPAGLTMNSVDDGLFSPSSAAGGGVNSSFSSRSSSPFQPPAHSTENMLSVAEKSAPAPTMEMVNDITYGAGALSLSNNTPTAANDPYGGGGNSWNDTGLGGGGGGLGGMGGGLNDARTLGDNYDGNTSAGTCGMGGGFNDLGGMPEAPAPPDGLPPPPPPMAPPPPPPPATPPQPQQDFSMYSKPYSTTASTGGASRSVSYPPPQDPNGGHHSQQLTIMANQPNRYGSGIGGGGGDPFQQQQQQSSVLSPPSGYGNEHAGGFGNGHQQQAVGGGGYAQPTTFNAAPMGYNSGHQQQQPVYQKSSSMPVGGSSSTNPFDTF